MSIVSAKQTPRNSYTATSSQTVFNIGFEFFNVTDIKVYRNGTLLSYSASPTLVTEYSISGTEAPGDDAYEFGSGGSITLGSGATAGDIIVIIRDIGIERITDFVPNASFSVADLNTQLDQLTAMVADLDQQSQRSVKLLDTDTIAATVTLPAKATRASKVATFDSNGNLETTIAAVDVTTIAGIAADVSTVAGISANVTTVAGISANVTTVAGISGNVTTVAGISSDVTSVAGNSSNINTVAGINANITTVAGISSDVTSVAGVSTDVTTVAGEISPTNNISTVAGLNTEIAALGAISSDITTVSGIAANVTSVAGNASNINTVAGISANITTVAGISADVTTVAGISSDVTAVSAISTAVSNVNANSTNINAVNANATNINTVAGINADITTVAGIAANVTTVANNVAGVNSFAERYRVASSDPVTSLDAGDLVFNTTGSVLKYYDGTAWQGITPGGITDVVQDATPQLGGDLDLNSSNITGTGNINITGTIDASSIVTAPSFVGDLTGAVEFDGKADVDIDKGEVVYISGLSGNTPTVALARANSSSTIPAMGIAAENITATNTGKIVSFGDLPGLDVANFGETSITFAVGDTVYVSSAEAGKLTNVAPSGESNFIQNIGRVARISPTTNATIIVGGAGRTNASPALNDGNIFIGNSSNVVTTTSLQTQVESYSINNIVEDTSPQLGGNLDTQSFTVDGRDVSTDGTKLDTIATNATANPNAIDNVVEDTTPQLGGDLDTNSNHIYTANGGIVTRPNVKPLIINGDMAIAQRGASTTGITGIGYFTVDRMKTLLGDNGTWTHTQDTDVPTGQGFANSWKLDNTTADTSVGAGAFHTASYFFEGQDLQLLKKGTASAEKVTVSFWIKTTVTGTYIAELYDGDNTRQISQAYTVSSSNTWEKKVLSFAGDTTGALDDDNANSLILNLWLGAGSDYTSGTLNTSWGSVTTANRAVGQVNGASSTSNNIYITGLQMEVGEYTSTTLPPFQHESHADSLLRCQRYYEKTNPATETPGQTDGAISANWGILNAADSSTLVLSMIQWKVDKRVSPTMTFYATDGTSGSLNVNGTNRTVSANFVGETNLGRISVASGGTAGNYVAFMFEAAAEL